MPEECQDDCYAVRLLKIEEEVLPEIPVPKEHLTNEPAEGCWYCHLRAALGLDS
jgi:hypothetical protein